MLFTITDNRGKTYTIDGVDAEDATTGWWDEYGSTPKAMIDGLYPVKAELAVCFENGNINQQETFP